MINVTVKATGNEIVAAGLGAKHELRLALVQGQYFKVDLVDHITFFRSQHYSGTFGK